MKQSIRKTGGLFLLLGLVWMFAMVCGPDAKRCYADEAGTIEIDTPPQASATLTYGGEYATLSVEAHATNGNVLSYKWYKAHHEGGSGYVMPLGNSREQLIIPDYLPGNYEYYCEISAAGCTTVTSSSTTVTINKAVYEGMSEATVYVVSGYAYELPVLPVSDMAYTVGTITDEAGLIQDSYISHYDGRYVILFGINAAAAGSSAVIELAISGGDWYQDACFTLTVELPAKTLVGITEVGASNSTYSGLPCAGYSGTPVSGGYVGSLEYHYYGRLYTAYDSTTAPSLPGNYRLVISVPENDPQYAGSMYLDFSIYKQGVRAKINAVTVKEGQSLPKPVISYSGFLGTDTAASCILVDPSTYYEVSDSSSPGSYTIYCNYDTVLTYEASKLYDVYPYNGTLTVIAKSSACDVTGISLNGAVIEIGTDTGTISAEVANNVESGYIGPTVSEYADCKMYQDENCTTLITDPYMSFAVGDSTVYLKVTAENGTASKVYTLTVTRQAPDTGTDKINLIDPPVDVTLGYGETEMLGVFAETTNGAAMTYQWYEYIPATATGQEIPGATGDSFEVPADQAPGTYYYYCILRATDCNDVRTPRAKVTITKAVYGGQLTETLYAVSYYEKGFTYLLPELPSGMSYSDQGVSASGELGFVNALADGQLAWWVSSRPAGASLTITIPIIGNQYYEDSTFTLTQTAVDPIPVTITGITAEDSIYGMDGPGYTGTPSAGAYTGTLKYYYTGTCSDGTSYDSDDYAPFLPGSYTLTVSIPEGELYTGSQILPFIIAKKELTAKADDKTIRQGEPLPAATVSYSGFAYGESKDYVISLDAGAALTVTDSLTVGVSEINIVADEVLYPFYDMCYYVVHEKGNLSIVPSEGTWYIVSFNTGAGSAVASQIVDDSGVVSRPADPTYAGYIFAGWYIESSCTTVFDFVYGGISSDITLYAKWTQKDPGVTYYTVSFSTGAGSAVASQSVVSGAKAVRPADPTNTGYTFADWYADSSYVTVFDFANTAITANTTVYAKWTQNPPAPTSYTVSFSTGAGSAVTSQSIASGEKASRPADPSYTGYTFGGWYTNNSYTTVFDFANTAITADTTVYAKWTQNAPEATYYTVSFNTGAGSAVADQSIALGEKASRPADPAYTGYTFGGWYTNSSYTTAFDFANTAITANTTVYARWSYNGGTPSGGGSTPADTGSTSPESEDGKGGTVYEIGENNEAAWSEAVKAIQSGGISELTVELNGTTVIPAQLLQAAAGKDITVTVKLGDTLSWNIRGSSLTAPGAAGWQAIDFNAELTGGVIPQEALENLFGQNGAESTEEVLQLHLSHEGSFGFTASLRVCVGAGLAGKMANLFYYNPNSGELEFAYAARIDSEGYAVFSFSHASDYAIAVDEKQLLLVELNKIQLTSSKKTLYIDGDIDTQAQLTLSIPDSLSGLDREDSLYPTVTYSSSNPEVASVGADGKVTAIKKGKATITATIKTGDTTQTLRLTITVKKAYIKLVKSKSSLKKGESFTYTAIGYGVSTGKITFTTTEKSVVVIDKKSGKAVAKTTGTDYVIARYGKIQVKQKVTVK